MLRIFGWLAVIFVVAAGASYFAYRTIAEQRAHEPLGIVEAATVVVEQGATVRDVLDQLEPYGVTQVDPWWIRYAVLKEQAHRIKSGEYPVLPGDDWATLLMRIVEGDAVQRRITFVEGWTAHQALDAVNRDTFLAGEMLSADVVVQELDLPNGHIEGWFLPETYAYVRNEARINVLRRAHASMQRTLAEVWQTRAPDLPLENPYDALILASIIEKETGRAEDRTLISSVFIRRLQRSMRLQTDPTVIYGLGDTFDGNLTRAHLREPTPYNTYVIHGLPPTPIALPGMASLQAAVQPAESEYLYFVARGDGSSQFSRTLQEHNRAVRRYQLGQQ